MNFNSVNLQLTIRNRIKRNLKNIFIAWRCSRTLLVTFRDQVDLVFDILFKFYQNLICPVCLLALLAHTVVPIWGRWVAAPDTRGSRFHERTEPFGFGRIKETFYLFNLSIAFAKYSTYKLFNYLYRNKCHNLYFFVLCTLFSRTELKSLSIS